MTRHLTTENGVEWNLNNSNLVKNMVGGIFLMVSVESQGLLSGEKKPFEVGFVPYSQLPVFNSLADLALDLCIWSLTQLYSNMGSHGSRFEQHGPWVRGIGRWWRDNRSEDMDIA